MHSAEGGGRRLGGFHSIRGIPISPRDDDDDDAVGTGTTTRWLPTMQHSVKNHAAEFDTPSDCRFSIICGLLNASLAPIPSPLCPIKQPNI